MGWEWSDLAAAGVGAGSGMWEGWRNRKFQEKVNEKNEELMREAWARDDTAIQRQAADMEAAGLSKTLAAGGGAASSNAIKLEPLEASHNVAGQAMDAMMAKKSIAQTEAQTQVTKAQARKENASADLLEIQASNAQAVHGTGEDLVAEFAKVRRELGLKDEQDLKLAMMSDQQKLSAAKTIHYEEFAALELEQKRNDVKGAKARAEQLELANALLEKDLRWYAVKQSSQVLGNITGAARNVVPYIPWVVQ